MAHIENRSRTQVSVKNRPELTQLFPYDKKAPVSQYMAALREQGHKPMATVTTVTADKIEAAR